MDAQSYGSVSFWVPDDKLPKTPDDLAKLRAKFWVHGSGAPGPFARAWNATRSCLVPCALPPQPSKVLGE